MNAAVRSLPPLLVSWSFGLLVLALYVGTLAPGLTGGDSGELISAATSLGVAHPPGYPLWTLLGHLFSYLPFGSVAWRLNFFSAVCAAAAAGVLCRTIQWWTRHCAAGIFGAGLFAVSPLVWEYATCAEVFALNQLLLALVLLTATRFYYEPTFRRIFECAFVCGLALTNHHTALFVVTPIALFVMTYVFRLRGGSARYLSAGALGAVLGLAPYLFLPLAAHFNREWSWGECDSWPGFIAHLLRREYGTFQLASGSVAIETTWWAQWRAYWSASFHSLTGVGVPLAWLGATVWLTGKTFRFSRPMAGLLLVSLGLYLGIFLSLVNLPPQDPLLGSVLARFWMLPDQLLCALAGVGFAWLLPKETKLRFAWLVAALTALGAAWWQFPHLPRRSTLVADYGRAILSPLPTNAVLLIRGDLPANAVRYAQSAEGFRPDLTVLNLELLTRAWEVRQSRRLHPALVLPGQCYAPGATNGFSLADLVNANAKNFSCWLYPEPKPGDATSAQFNLWPCGFPQQLLPATQKPANLEAWSQTDQAELRRLRERFAAQPLLTASVWEQMVIQDYWSAEHRHAFTWLQWAWAHPADRSALQQAMVAYEDLLNRCPENLWFAWKNLGLIYERSGALAPDQKLRQLKAWEQYLQYSPTDDPDRAVIARHYEQLRAVQ